MCFEYHIKILKLPLNVQWQPNLLTDRNFGICMNNHIHCIILLLIHALPIGICPSSDLQWKYWIDHVATYSKRRNIQGIPDFVAKCTGSDWCRGSTTCHLYVIASYMDFCSKVNMWNVKSLRARVLVFDSRTDIIVKVSKFWSWRGLDLRAVIIVLFNFHL